MNTYPLVSVVTPSYNQAQFLERTIRSVLEQDYPKIEYIVCDGGSTDDSVEIVRNYKHRLTWWCSEHDGGQSDAINKGFRYASGDILAWLNSDDVYLPGAVSAAVNAFARHQEAGLVYGNIQIIDEDGHVTGGLTGQSFTLAGLLTHDNIISQPAAFWRREVADTVGPLRTDLHYVMDFEYWIRIAQRFRIVHINQTLAQFRVSMSSKTGAQSARWGGDLLKVMDELYATPDLPETFRSLETDSYAGVYYQGGLGFLTAYEMRTAREWLFQAARLRRAYIGRRAWWLAVLKALAGRRVYGWGRELQAYRRYLRRVKESSLSSRGAVS